jgi:hypothetical protein
MIKFLLSDKAVLLLFLSNYLSALGWCMVKFNGGTESEFPLYNFFSSGLGAVVFFWGRAVLRAKCLA